MKKTQTAAWRKRTGIAVNSGLVRLPWYVEIMSDRGPIPPASIFAHPSRCHLRGDASALPLALTVITVKPVQLCSASQSGGAEALTNSSSAKTNASTITPCASLSGHGPWTKATYSEPKTRAMGLSV